MELAIGYTAHMCSPFPCASRDPIGYAATATYWVEQNWFRTKDCICMGNAQAAPERRMHAECNKTDDERVFRLNKALTTTVML